ncbi:MAG: DEAD/DEAH box helicase [Alistipes sp.]|jgi:ATP-dependent RNA helicase RhlE|nr:DEAD/DEAH box helicase [Alistipes sp.]
MTFDDLEIAEPILRAVREKGYDTPTPIQEQAIPVVLSGEDIFGIAQTGTGKTAVFAIPILQMLWEEKQRAAEAASEPAEKDLLSWLPKRKDRRGRRHGKPAGKSNRTIRALVLTPTRELALQIDENFTDYGKHTGLKHTVVFGGVKQGPQTERLGRGVDILVATPGRLLDLIGQGFISLDTITHFVLDEADRMLDMGFIGDIRRIVAMLPDERQTLFFSATMPAPIVSLSKGILTNPVRVEVTPESSTVDTVKQCIYFVEKPDRKSLLVSLLREHDDKTVLIFSRTKHGADNISKILIKANINSAAIHGDKSQSQRQKALADFKAGKVRVMVATDIAARGIDIKELGLVINFDLPDVVETYVHRIGRTGRAGAEGMALTFCSQDDHMMIKDIQKVVGRPLDMRLHQS